MANPYQDALLNRFDAPGFAPGSLGNPTDSNPGQSLGGGIQGPGTTLDQPPPPPAPSGPPDYQSVFMNATKGKQYGQQGYADLEKELGGQGFQFQKNSAGQYRGRVKAPDGQLYDTALNEGNDSAFLGGGQGTGAFGMLGRGHESATDIGKGGWSFGGGGMPSSGMALPMPGQANLGQAGISQDTPGYGEASPYLAALMQMLGAQS